LVPTIKRFNSFSVLLPEFCTCMMNPRFYKNAFNTTNLEVLPPNGRKMMTYPRIQPWLSTTLSFLKGGDIPFNKCSNPIPYCYFASFCKGDVIELL
jgi:hypothetical protein